MLLGIWRNVEDLEDALSLPELEAILMANDRKQRNFQRFYAAFKGVDLDEGERNSTQDAFDRVKRRAEAKLRGVSEDDVQKMEDSDIFGIDFETED